MKARVGCHDRRTRESNEEDRLDGPQMIHIGGRILGPTTDDQHPTQPFMNISPRSVRRRDAQAAEQIIILSLLVQSPQLLAPCTSLLQRHSRLAFRLDQPPSRTASRSAPLSFSKSLLNHLAINETEWLLALPHLRLPRSETWSMACILAPALCLPTMSWSLNRASVCEVLIDPNMYRAPSTVARNAFGATIGPLRTP